MSAVMYVDRPSYRALILRRTLQELTMPGALISRSKEWWAGTGAVYNENLHRWKFPSGAEVWFGYLQSQKDVYRYMSSEWDFIGIDELTQIREQDYTLISGRLRKTTTEIDLHDVPLRFRAASNPPTEEQEVTGWWVKIRFVDRGWPYFVPSYMSDNPYIDDHYMERLRAMYDPITFAKLAGGDWNIRSQGGIFRRNWFDIVTALPTSGWLHSTRGWDTAGTKPHPGNPDPDWTRGMMCARHASGDFYLFDLISLRDEPTEVAALIQQTHFLDPLGVEYVFEQEPADSGKYMVDMYGQMLTPRLVHIVPSNRQSGSKISRATPLAIQAKNGRVKLLKGADINTILEEFVNLGSGRVHDDIVDGAALAFNRTAFMSPLDPRMSGMGAAFAHRGTV